MLDLQAELHDHAPAHQDLYEAVVALKRRHDLHPCSVRPRDGLAMRGDGEREQVQELMARFRRLPEDTRRQMPALLNSLAQLEVVVGDLEASQRDFTEVARLVADPIARAEAHHNVYRAALERRDWDGALQSLRRAVLLDPDTFEPFPFARYEPARVLGAGGLGVTFACQDREAGRPVVVKALRDDALDREPAMIFGELEMLREIDPPAVVRVLATGFAGPPASRPYLVTEPFDGEPLGDFTAHHGPLSPEECIDLAWPLARALQVLHHRGALHRSLRPAAVLVRRERGGEEGPRLRVKLLDTGLSLKRALIHASGSNPDAALCTGLGRSVAQTVPFAPPEVFGRPKGQVWVGPHSDLYSLGKLCAFALTGRADPDRADRLLLPEAWQRLLDALTGWTINRRPGHAGIVLEQLAQAPGAEARIGALDRDLNEAALTELDGVVAASPSSADAFAQRGQAHLREGDVRMALADFTEAIRLRPGDAALYRRRAEAQARGGNGAAAVSDYTEALRLEPRSVEALVGRALALLERGDHGRAAADLTEALRHAPHDAGLYFHRGNALARGGDRARAIADYTEVIRLDSRHVWALAARGEAYRAQGEPARAIADYTRILQVEPGNLQALADRAAANRELGRLDRAIADYTEALKHGASAALYHDRGQAHLAAGSAGAAVADFTAALALAPGNVALLLVRAEGHQRLGQHEQALADLDAAVGEAPNSGVARVVRGGALARLGRYEEAIADFSEGIRLDGPSAAALAHRAAAHAARKDHAQAVADYTEALRLSPRLAGAHARRGQCYLHLGDLERAALDLDEALELDANDLSAHLARAGLRARQGRTEEALADYAEALRLDPASGEAYLGRGRLRAAQGQATEALADLKQAARLRPDDPAPHLHRGNLFADQGKQERALAAFGEAIRLAPEHLLARYNRATVQLELGRDAEALAELDEVLRLAPGHAEALTNRAVARWRLGDREGAMRDLNEAVELSPDLAAARYNRACLLLAQPGDEGGVAEDLAALLEAQPDDAGAANNLAWLLATGAAPAAADRALELAQRACAVEETSWRLDTLAAALAARGDLAEAVEAQRRAVEQAPEADRADYRARLSLYESGQRFTRPPPAPE